MSQAELPPGVQVLERSWLSSNSVLFLGGQSTALVDSGHCANAEQTLSLLASALRGRPLDCLVNTHLHSDHCGGNAALQGRWPSMRTSIPPGLAEAVAAWDPVTLGYQPTGQHCPRFRHDAVVLPGTETELGGLPWQVHAAPGHDPDSVILFEPGSRVLISADALWESGFGVVFPELEGDAAFAAVGRTFDLIEKLGPHWVIPGHGPVFRFEAAVLRRARDRLQAFVRDPGRHAHHAAKVLLKFKLLEHRQLALADLTAWAAGTPHLQGIHRRFAADVAMADWIASLTQELVHSRALLRIGDTLHDA